MGTGLGLASTGSGVVVVSESREDPEEEVGECVGEEGGDESESGQSGDICRRLVGGGESGVDDALRFNKRMDEPFI
jgi:hypothetical protein